MMLTPIATGWNCTWRSSPATSRPRRAPWRPANARPRRLSIFSIGSTPTITNQAFLIELLESDAFRSGGTFTHTVEEWAPARVRQEPEPAALVAAALGFQAARSGVRAQGGEARSGRLDPFNPWRTAGRWRV